jgi:hypothetical protein
MAEPGGGVEHGDALRGKPSLPVIQPSSPGARPAILWSAAPQMEHSAALAGQCLLEFGA